MIVLLLALGLAACGDDSGGGGGDTIAGTPCMLGGGAAQTSVQGCPANPDGTPRATMCSMAGGTVTRVCHAPGTMPALPAATSATAPAVPGQGIWSACCCNQGGSLFCGGAGAGTSGMTTGGITTCGNRMLDATEMCDASAPTPLRAGTTCPNGAAGIVMCTAQCTLNTSMCPGTGMVTGGGGG